MIKTSYERGNKTRRERHHDKQKVAEKFPISIATVNLKHEVNLAYVIRAAVCFGAEEVCVIGGYPSRRLMNELSGSLFDYIKVRAFPNPNALISYTEREDIALVSIELPPDEFKSHPITEYKFDFSKRICLVTGHETFGVPADILFKSEIIHIEMPGAGFCLNTATTAAIALYEATKQFKEFNEQS